jgi:hypothetical protein
MPTGESVINESATQVGLLGMPNKRRTADEMATLREEIAAVLSEDHPQTCRSVFYRLVSRRAVPKTEAAYQGVVVRLLTRMRLDGAVPFEWITDGTRLRRKPNSARNMAAALERIGPRSGCSERTAHSVLLGPHLDVGILVLPQVAAVAFLKTRPRRT